MPKAPAAAEGGDAKLQKDVKAQLASLGFGSGGGGFSDGAFDDFAPEKAKQRIGGGQPKGQAGQQQQRRQGAGGRGDGKAGGRGTGRGDGRQGGRGRGQGQQRDGDRGGRGQGQQRDGDRGGRGQGQQRDADRGGRGQGQQRWQQGGGGAAAGQQQRRSWGGGGDGEAAPAPKIPNAKSILPKDEPTIWHEAAGTLPALAAPTEEAAPELVAAKRKQAERLLLVEEQAFEQNMGRRSSADAKWLQQVRRSGTTADRVAAMSVLLQDGAVANLPSLDGLLAMVSKKGGARAVVGSAMDALKELFTTVLLPDRKLRFFEQQPLDKVEAGREGERRLLYWLVEDGVKKRYATYVDALEACSRDNLEYVKDRAVKALFELLSAKPEQEARLLSALVNKLGDPDRKLASKVGYLLTRLLAEHPGMSVPVVREVERFMFRPGLQERARYYAVVYLNQMVLNHKQQAQAAAGGSLARRLIDVYFTVFKMVLDGKIGTAAQLAKAQADKAAEAAAKRKKGEAAKARAAEEARQKAAAAAAATSQQGSGEMDSRMLSALITGVRRAFPYVPADEVEPLIEAHADALFRLVHARSFGVATQALLLLFQLMSSRSTVSDRFYRALYAVLGSPELYRSTKSPMFLSLLFKAIKADVSAKRTAAFAKRMLQVAQESPAHFACGCLLLTSELLKARPALWGAVLQPEESEADGLERFQDAPEDGPAAAAGQQAEGGSARRAGRRAAAAAGGGSDGEGGSGSEDGSDAEEEGGQLKRLAGSGSSSEEEEEEEGDSAGEQDLMPGLRQQQAAAAAAAAQRAAKQAAAAADAQRWPASKEAYDLHKREPQYSNADRSCLWELTSLAAHVHPSVAAMARTLLAGQNVLYDGDPLRDLTLGAFLEKFVQKKAKAGAKGDSAMQPLAARPDASAGPQQWAALAGAQADALAALAEKEVRPDDMFFHKYYSLQAVQDKAKAKKKKKGEGEDELLSDAESEDSDAADDFLVGQEEGGDDGIGADPDRSGRDYDYADLAAAMDSGDDSDAAGASDSELDASEDEEAGGRFSSKFAAAAGGGDDSGSGSEGEAAGGSGSDWDSEGDAEELAGATFSDMSDSEDEEGGPGSGPGGRGGPGSDSELSGSERGEGDDSSDDGFEAELAAEDFSEDEDEDGSGSSGSEEDDAAADAEVAALIRKHKIQPLATAAAGSDEELNPFELAEASSSDDDDAGAAAPTAKAGGKRGRQQEQQEQQRQKAREARRAAKVAAASDAAAASGGRQKRKKSSDPMSIFASADDYAEMIEQDLAGGAGLDDGEEPAGSRPSAGGKQRRPRHAQQPGGGGGRGGAPKRQQAPGGGGRPAKQARRQR